MLYYIIANHIMLYHVKIYYIFSGIVMIILGLGLTEYIESTTSPTSQPDIWWLGLTVICINYYFNNNTG